MLEFWGSWLKLKEASHALARLHSGLEVYNGHQVKCVSLEELGNLAMYLLTRPQADAL